VSADVYHRENIESLAAYSIIVVAIKRLTSTRITNKIIISSKKYLTAAVVIIVYIEEVSALIATFCKFAWWNCTKKGWYVLFSQRATRYDDCHCDYHC